MWLSHICKNKCANAKVLSSDCVIYHNLFILKYITVNKLISNIISNLYHKKFQDLNINKSYFCIFDGIRRNFNWRSIYKNLLYALSFIIYGVKAWINNAKVLSSDCVIYHNLFILKYITVNKLISNIISNFYTYICLSCIFNS
jgi:hypothetical protein